MPHDLYPPLSQMRGGRTDFGSMEGTGVTLVTGGPSAIAEQVRSSSSEIVALGNAFEYRRDASHFAAAMVALRGVGRLQAPGLCAGHDGRQQPGAPGLHGRGPGRHVAAAVPRFPHGGKHGRGGDLRQGPKWIGATTTEEAYAVSLQNAARELQLVRHMIAHERLRELVEMRIHASPWLVAALRIYDEGHYDFQEKYFPVIGPRFYCNAKQSLTRPDILRYRKRIMERYVRPADKKVLLLIPCSAKKPYYSSKSHQAFKRVLTSVSNFDVVHEVIITSPLGAVPRELELYYPAAQYDIPVTGHWDREEVAMVQEMVKRIVSFGYDHIICHLGDESEFVLPVLNEFVDTTKTAS